MGHQFQPETRINNNKLESYPPPNKLRSLNYKAKGLVSFAEANEDELIHFECKAKNGESQCALYLVGSKLLLVVVVVLVDYAPN